MKNKVILITLLIFCSNLFGQEFKFPKITQSNFVAIPGTHIMIDRCEASVSDWLSFVYNKYYDENVDAFNAGFDSIMPDTNLLPEKYHLAIRMFWRLNSLTEGSTLFSNVQYYGTNSFQYFSMPYTESEKKVEKKLEYESWDSTSVRTRVERILTLPMVGITYEQVQMYLQWRTGLVKDDKSIIKSGYDAKVRLMTKEEWIKLATQTGPRFPENNTAHIDTVNKLGCYLLNVQVIRPCKSVLEGKIMYKAGAVTVYAYNADRLGLYNLFGNVWEMTNEKGIAIGGSYAGYANVCDATKTLSYSVPKENIGFRCVLELTQ